MLTSLYHRRFPDRKIPPPNPLVMVILVALWLTVGCAVPLHRVHEARREGREKLLGFLSADRPDKAGVIRVFETANQDLDAAASGPCLILSASIIYLVWQVLKLKRRYNEIDPRSRDASTPN